MKLKNKLIILLTILILTGCTAKADITINENYSVDEKVNISFDNSKTINFKSPTKYAESYLEYYNSAISYKDYEYDINEGSDFSSVDFTKSTDGICTSINNNLFSQYVYKYIKCVEDDNHILISSEGEQLISLPISQKKFDIESLVLNIKIPVIAEENNADNVNEKTYTWNFNSSSPSDKSVYLKLNKKELEEAEKNYLKQEKIKDNLKIGSTILIVVVILITLVCIAIKFYKKYKSNKIDY